MGEHLILERYQWFDRQVRENKYPNATSLSRRFEINSKTARRNIDFMRDRLLAPLDYVPEKKGYRYEEGSFDLPDLRVTQEELVSILIARDLLSYSAQGIISKTIQSFGKKLFYTMGGLGFTGEKMKNAFSAVWNGYSPAQADIFRVMLEALLGERVIRCKYTSPGTGKKTEREIEPHHLQHYMGSWVLIGWCRLRKDWRKFYLSRMTDMASTEKRFKPRASEEWEHLIESSFGIFQGKKETKVTLRFNPFRAGWIREQVWHPKQRINELEEGGLDLTFPVADFREVKMKILQFGADVKVIEPPELIEEIKLEIEKMTKIY